MCLWLELYFRWARWPMGLLFIFDSGNSFFLFCEQPLHAGQSLGCHRQGHWSIPGVSPVLLVIRPTRHGSKKASGCHPQGPRRLPPTTSDRRRSCGVWIPGVLETILKKSKNYYLGFRIYKINDILLSVYIKLMMSNFMIQRKSIIITYPSMPTSKIYYVV